jgi:phage terminase large subunit
MSNTATINLLPKQTEAWEEYENPEVTELGYGGASGGGKTRLGWYLCISICEQYPGAKGAVGRKELKTLRTTTLVELWTIFNELGYREGSDYTFDGKDNIIKFQNGSQIMLLDTAYSPQDPEYTRFGSLPLTFGWIDESNETPEKGKAILKTRVGRANKFIVKEKNSKGVEVQKEIIVKPFWLETFNPNKGHVYRDYYKLWKEGTLPSYRRFIRALPGDNPYLPKAYIENLERADNITKQRLLYGNFDFDSDPNKIIDYQAIMDLTRNVIVFPLRPVKTLIVDVARFGGDKIVLGAYNDLNLYGLWVYTYQGTDETVKRIKEICVIEQIAISNVLVDEDGIGGGVVDNLKGCRGFSGNASPAVMFNDFEGKMSHENYQNCRSQCYFILAGTVNGHGMSIKVTKFETNIEGYTLEKALSDMAEELDAIKQKDNSEDGKKAIIPKSEIREQLGRSPDFADILMMRMFFQVREPTLENPPFIVPPTSRRTEVKKNRAR